VRPEEALELIVSAPQRYDSVRAALRYRGDGSTMRTLRDRYRKSEAYRLETGGPPDPSEEIWCPEPDAPFGWSCREWYAKVRPDGGPRYRLEVELPREVYPDGGVYISAWDGRVSDPNTAVRARIGGGSLEEDPPWLWLAQDSFWSTYLFDFDGIAGFPLVSRELSVEGETRKVGREAIRLVGVPEEEWGGGTTGRILCGGERTSTSSWWTQSEACCCAAPRGWGARTSPPWRLRRSTSMKSFPRTSFPRASPYRDDSGSPPRVANFLERRACEVRRIRLRRARVRIGSRPSYAHALLG
jgi:hypothetical protein